MKKKNEICKKCSKLEFKLRRYNDYFNHVDGFLDSLLATLEQNDLITLISNDNDWYDEPSTYGLLYYIDTIKKTIEDSKRSK